MSKKLTDKRFQALMVIALNGTIIPTQFASKMWPDSPAHRISYNVGKSGAVRGRGIVMSAGSYLGKLGKGKLTKRQYARIGRDDHRDIGYVLTEGGWKDLIDHGLTEQQTWDILGKITKDYESAVDFYQQYPDIVFARTQKDVTQKTILFVLSLLYEAHKTGGLVMEGQP